MTNPYALQTRVYALYVLSLAGRPQLGTMTYIKNHQFEKLSHYSVPNWPPPTSMRATGKPPSLFPVTTAASPGSAGRPAATSTPRSAPTPSSWAPWRISIRKIPPFTGWWSG